MKFCEGFALILSVLSVSFAMDQTCKWIMDVLEMVTDPINGATEFRLYQSSIQVGYLYFVRLRISCEDRVWQAIFFFNFKQTFCSKCAVLFDNF